MQAEEKKNTGYIIRYDLDLNGEVCSGQLKYAGEMIETVENGVTVRVIRLNEASDFKLTLNTGCAYIECKHMGEDMILCRLTLGFVAAAGEFCKILNYRLLTGKDPEKIEEDIRECPKCGRKLAENTSICFFCTDKLHVFRKTMKLLEKFKKPLIISGLIMAISNVMYIAAPVLNRILIDDYLRPKTGKISGILMLCGAMLAMRAIGEVIYIFGSRMSNRVGGSIADSLRRRMYAKVQELSMASMSKKTSGDLLKRITNDTQRIREFITNQGRWAFERLSMLIVIAIILFVTNAPLALLIFIPVPFAMLVINHFWKFIRNRYHLQWRLHSYSNSILHDIIKGIRVVKTFGNEEREIAKFDRSCKKLADVSASNEKYWTTIFSPLGFLIGSSEFLVLYFGGRAVLGRELTMGELVQFTMYLVYIYEPLRWMTQIPRWLADLMTSMVKMFEILDEEPEIKNAVAAGEPDIKGNIEFKDVTFGYKSYDPVLKNITLDIKQGEMIGVVGHSGVGKSTMINLIMRLYDVNSGKILIDGCDIRNISQKVLHESVGAVFQDTFLFAGTIYENIVYARPEASFEDVMAASMIANAHEFVIKLSDAYNTVIGENGYSLSGGERQRIAIARAVLRNPSILILDEATATLDVETENRIQEALARLTKNRTTIAIAHRLSTLRNADRLIVLDKGRLAETGTHVELLKNKGVYFELVMAQRQTAKLKKDA